MKTILSLCWVIVVAMVFYCGCDPLKNRNLSQSRDKGRKNMVYENYTTHHLLDSDPNRFLNLYSQHVPEAFESSLNYLFENIDPSLPYGRKGLEADVATQEKITTDILLGSLHSKQYSNLKAQAQILLQGKAVEGFIALESFERRGFGAKSDVIYSYKCMWPAPVFCTSCYESISHIFSLS